ncbi:MAG: hypothetical protein ABGX08_17425 [Citromicrobium sp.]
MAIGTMAAIGLGLGAVGSVVGASSSNRAASRAADAQVQASQQNAQVAREIYGQNRDVLNPYVQRGNAAGDALNDMLGLGGTPAQPMQQQPNALTQFAPQQRYGVPDGAPSQYRARAESRVSYFGEPDAQPMNALTQFAQTTQPTATPAVSAEQAQNNAFDGFRNYIRNSDYGFQFGEGSNAVNSGYAGAGTLQSGAAMRALEDYRQNLQSGYRGEYMNLLSNQQGVGLGAGSALAGVGQNYAGLVTSSNNQAANAQANLALSQGQNNPFANVLGFGSGALMGLGR